jgi:dihydroxy-acid dehydratase
MPDDVRKPAIDKSRLPSRHVTVGPERAPHRAFLYSMGLTEEQIAQPLVGVATTWNEAAPCNIALARQAQVVKKGVAAAHGTPREFTTITVTDGIAMGHAGMKSSLISREIIADSVELTMRGHCYDALVGLAGCDKSLPGMMMIYTSWNASLVPRQGRAAASSPPTRWLACRRRSGWRCRVRLARRPPTIHATPTLRPRARR